MLDRFSRTCGLCILLSKNVNKKARSSGGIKPPIMANKYRELNFRSIGVAPVSYAGSITRISETLADFIISASPRFARKTL